MSFVRLLPLLAAAARAGRAARAELTDAEKREVDFEWERVVYEGDDVPNGIKDAAVGYDRVRNRLIVFGGKPGPTDETWQFDLASRVWTQLVTGDGDARPQKRFSMVYGMDEQRGRFLVSTGEGPGKKFFNDVWAFNLTANTWSELATSGDPPEKRYGAGGGTFVFGASHLFVTHGFSGRRYGNSRAFNLDTHVWTSVTPHGTVPFKRCLVGSVAHEYNRVTMFGGCGSGGHGPCPAQDVWTLHTQAAPNASLAPSRDAARWAEHDQCEGPRMFTSMAVAPGHAAGLSELQRLVVFGGTGAIYGSGGAGEVGVLHLGTGKWTLVRPAGDERPSVRKQCSLVYINGAAGATADGDYTLLFGGSSGGGDMWVLRQRATAGDVDTLSCPYVFDLRLFHGVTMFLSWGLILPLGVAAARFGRHYPNALWFRLHRPLQMTGVLLQLAGFVAAMLMVPVGKFSAQPHAGIGALVFLLGILQPVNAFFRPHAEKGHEKTKNRRRWEALHLWSGRVALVLGTVNPFWGLKHIRARGVFHVLYAVWFAVYWLFWLVMSLRGEPTRSPAARWLNAKLLGGRFALNLGGAPMEASQPVPMSEPTPTSAGSAAAPVVASEE